MHHRKLMLIAIFLLSFLVYVGLSSYLRSRLGHRIASHDVLGLGDHKHLCSAVTARYPLRFFDGSTGSPNSNSYVNFRDQKSTYSQKLVDSISTERNWAARSRSRDHKDVWLYEKWFFGMEKGVILESGLIDSVATSATFLFETLANWTAIHVESDPDHFLEIANLRTNAINVHAAFCNESKAHHYSSLGILPGRGFVEHMTTDFIKTFHNHIHNNDTGIDELPTLHCITPKSSLQLVNIKYLDIWILANDGDDESSLIGMDFQDVSINAVVFECDSQDADKDLRLTKIVESNGFKCVNNFPNCFCKNNNYSPKEVPQSLKSVARQSNDGHRKHHHIHHDDYSRLMSAVTFRYPYSILNDERQRNWKSGQFINTERIRQENSIIHEKKSRPWNDDYNFSFAQDDEDVYLYENFFFGVENGVILESGALDGKEFSNSLFFEKYLNWTSLLVEADPDNYAKLLLNRPNAININAALCNEPRLLHWSGYGSSDAVKGFVELMPKEFLKRWHGLVFNNKSIIDSLPSIQCMTVKKMLYELNIKRVDIWILDVEGAEESVLAGVDFTEVRFNVIMMECDEYDRAQNDRKMDFVRSKGFNCQQVNRNCMCKNDIYKRSGIQSSIRSTYHIEKSHRPYNDKNVWD